MKTKPIVLALTMSLFSCALFAQNQKDTVPQPQKTDTLKTDTKTDTTKSSAFIHSTYLMNQSIVKSNEAALPVNENTLYGNTRKNKKGAVIS